MAQERRDAWGVDQGFPDDFDFWITRAYFGYLESYQSGEAPLLIWEGESPDVDLEYPIIWPIGKGWEVRDRGAKVVHQKRKRFIANSLYGKLIDRTTEKLKVDMAALGVPTEAAVWAGLGFHMKSEEFQYGPGILEETGGKTNHLMPVAFLGRREGGKVVAQSDQSDQGAAPAPAVATLVVPVRVSQPSAASTAPTAADPFVIKLRKAAQLNDTEIGFQKWAMTQPEANDPANSPVMALVFTDGPTGFYMQNRETR